MSRIKPSGNTVLRWLSNRRNALLVVAGLGVVIWAKPMGLLLWSRIRILTTIPRTAIADDALASAPMPKLPPEFDPQLPGTAVVRRDPFRVDGDFFPSEERRRAVAAAASAAAAGTPSEPSPAATDLLAIDPAFADDLPAPAEYERLRRAAESLRVQSAGRGLETAVVEGRAVRVGDTLETRDGEEFVLVEVVEGGIVLANGAREFVVRLPEVPGARVVASPRQQGGRP